MWSSTRRSSLVLLLVPFGLLVVLAQDSDQDDSDETIADHVWHQYCGALGTDDDPAPGPLKVDDYEFVAMSLLVRHGARNFLTDPREACHPPSRHTFEEHLQTPAYLLKHERRTAHVKAISEHSFNFKGTDWVPTLASPPAIDDENRCHGCMLSDAKPEFESLGNSVRMHYFPFLPSHTSLESLYLYSAQSRRSIASLGLLLGGMFPEFYDESTRSALRFHSRVPAKNDLWGTVQACPRAVKSLVTSFALPESQLAFAERWLRITGQNWTYPCHDPMMVARCTPGRLEEVLGLPADEGSALIKEAYDVLAEKAVARFTDYEETWKLAYTRILVELFDFMRMQASGKKPPVAVWSTVDTALVGMLTILGVWDKVWPQYSEAMIFELYKSKKQNDRVYFRLLRRGEPVPACKAPTPEGLCDLESWLPDDILAVRNESLWKERCSVAKHEEPSLMAMTRLGLDDGLDF